MSGIRLLGALAVFLGASASIQGASSNYEITIAAGPHQRTNTPIRAQVPVDRIGAQPTASVTLVGPDGKAIPAQWTAPSLLDTQRGAIHFILPQLPAGETIKLTATLSTDAQARGQGFAWQDTPGNHINLLYGNRPIVTYHYEPLDESTEASRVRTYKVFHHVYSPQGDRIVTNGLSNDPKVHSPHHRGIFYGFNRISYGNGQTADLWHCTEGAYQAHDRFLSSDEGPVLGRHRFIVSWHGKDKRTFAEEERELTVYHVPGGHLIEFASRMRSTAGRVRLDGDPQHAGCQFRAHNDVDAMTSMETIFIRPDGTGKAGETRNWDPQSRQGPVNLPWNAMSFVLSDKRYTVAYLDHPQNPKEARYSERSFGRFGSYFEYTLGESQPQLQINYRFWLQDGQMDSPSVARLSHDFVDPPQVTIRAVK